MGLPESGNKQPATAVDLLTRIAIGFENLNAILVRIADRLDPPPASIVGTPYIAGRIGCTTVWIAAMARRGEIPNQCILAGTGNGKPWKFHRGKLDDWLATR